MKPLLLLLILTLTSCTSNRADWDPGYGGDPVMAERMKKAEL